MASVPDFSAMSEEDFYSYLKNEGMIEEDVETLQKNGYNNKSIFHLNAERQYNMKLTDASRAILKVVLQHDPGKNEVDTGTKRNSGRLPSISDADHMKFLMFGLGKGVDTSEPLPLASSSFNEAVRIIHPDKCNITEITIDESQCYTNSVSSLRRQTSSAKASVSDLVGKVLTLEAEAVYKRQNEKERVISGEKKITRRLSFKPYCFQDKVSCSNKDSRFEEKLCEYLIQEIPEIGSEPVPSPADKVQHYLDGDSTRFDQVLQKAYKFIVREKITHYISEIELGAAVYTMSVSKKNHRCKKMEKAAGVEYLAEMGIGMELTQESAHEEKKQLRIGNMEFVKRGEGEAVLGYNLLPIFTLVCNEHRKVKKVLQLAVKFYLDRSCGPFLISCEYHNSAVYWKVDYTRDNKVLIGTSNKEDASIFYLHKRSCPCEFSISHCGETLKSASPAQVSKISHFLSANSKGNRHEGPVLMEGRAAKLTLRHPSRKKDEVSIPYWENDACYIKLAPRTMQKKTYLALKFSENSFESKCVESWKEEGKDLTMRFILSRVDSHIGTIMKHRLCSDSADIPTQPDVDPDIEASASEQENDLASILDIQTTSKMDEDTPHHNDEVEDEEDLSDSDEDLSYDDSDYDNSDC